MSLQIAAQHLASKGRGPDSQLVHMAPTEVAGLHALAKAHGGSLTINPETGLPEAGFLSNILPTVIGAGLMASGVGSPLAIGLMTGAGYGLIKGDLKAGLMAGLGAYGGAGMMGSVLGAGAGAAMEGAAAGVGNAGVGNTGAAMTAADANIAFAPEQFGSVAGQSVAPVTQSASQAAQYGLGPTTMGPSAIPQAAPMPTTTTAMPAPVDYAARNQAMADAAKTQMGINDASFADKLASAPDRIGKGISGIMQNPSQLMTGENLRYGLAAAAPAMFEEPKQATYEGDSEQAKYTYSPGRVETPEYLTSETATPANSYERQWYAPSYTRMASGGPVADMSAANAAQGMYIDRKITGFATGGEIDAIQGSNPQIIQSNFGANNPPMGMADGGRVDYEFDPVTKTYKRKETAPVAAVEPIMATTTSGGANPTLDPKVAEFLDRETPAERDARMQNVSNIIGLLTPGGMASAAMQGIGALVNPAAPYGGAPVVAMGSDSGFGGYGGINGMGAAMTGADADVAYGADQYGGGDTGGSSAGYDGSAVGGGYSDGSDGGYWANGGAIPAAKGRFLRGPGDGVSDSIPATIGGNQPARLADGEFVVPARIVSELGNGSSEAGARKLYAMMDRIQKARGKTTGKNKVATDSKAEKMLPA